MLLDTRNPLGAALLPGWLEWHGDLASWMRQNLGKLLGGLLIALVLVWLLKVFTRRLARLSQHERLPQGVRAQQLKTLATVIEGFGIFFIVFLTLMQALPLFGIDMKPLLASAGVAGVAIGFGAQTLVRDVVNGFFILVENQYEVGDVVKIAGVAGTVEEMTLRRTVLRDADGSVHVVPNSQVGVATNLKRGG
jgi:moderate conductance mechanosensitive channel